MQKHIKTYLEYYWIDQHEVRCENCWKYWQINIHHLEYKSHFWKRTKHLQDSIENLIALCQEDCHKKAHFLKEPYLTKEELQDIHNQNLHG